MRRSRAVREFAVNICARYMNELVSGARKARSCVCSGEKRGKKCLLSGVGANCADITEKYTNDYANTQRNKADQPYLIVLVFSQ